MSENITPVSMFVVVLVDWDNAPLTPPFMTTFPGDDTALAAELAEVFADEADVAAAMIGFVTDDPDEIADAILAASGDLSMPQ